MKIYITTLGRVDNQMTLDCLQKNGFRKPVALVVQSHEYEKHCKAYPDYEVLSLPSRINNLGATRKFLICKHRPRKEKVVLLDDDLLFYWRPNSDDWHLRYPPPRKIDDIFDEVEERLEDYAHVSVSAREGNNRIPDYWMDNTRYMRFLAYNTRLFPRHTGVEIGRVDGMSDFDLNLQLLRAGCPSSTCFRYAQDQPGTQTPGGCSLNRTNKTHEEEIRKMVGWHGEFVKTRQKKNKTGGEFGTRTELTIYWKKAFESSTKKPRRLSGV